MFLLENLNRRPRRKKDMKDRFLLFACAALLLMAPTLYADSYNEIMDSDGPGGRNITAFDRASKLVMGGYFDTEWVSDTATNTFKAHRLILAASSKLHKNLFFNAEIEYEYGGLINAGSDDGELKIEQAWLDYRISDAVVLRGGVVVVPFGLVNVLHDSDVRDTTNRPIYGTSIVPTTWMDSGAGLHGKVDVGEDLIVRYEGYIINGLTSAISGTSGVRSARPSLKSDNNRNKALVGRVAVSPYLGLEVGGSVYTGQHDVAEDYNLSMIGLDVLAKEGPFEVMAEWAQTSVESDGTLPAKMNGYYVEGRYHFFPAFLKNTGLFDDFRNPQITAFLRFGGVDLDTSVTDINDRTQTTVGFNYRPIQTVAFKLEYELNGEEVSNVVTNKVAGSVAVGF
ncbi:MAG: phosphate-selective porin [Candidatus Marinamargulisbacteria bacterium]|jgi:phosphate-selective porin